MNTKLINKGGVMVTESGLVLPGHFRPGGAQGSTGLSIKDAHKQADAVLDTQANALKDDSVFVPMGDRITVKRIAEAELSSHGLFLPDTGKTPPAFGVVVGVGQGRYNLVGQLIPCRVQKGAVVMFGKYAGTDVPLFGVGSRQQELLILREEEIFGVVMSADDYARIVDATPIPEVTGVAK
jgi:chaperonin GroES